VWQGRRRLAQVEKELTATRAAQRVLQQRVELFEKIAAAAGASLDGAEPGDGPAGSLAPVPPNLLAAAAERRAAGSSVRLAVGGRDVIAVIGDEGGDPREWWTALHKFAARLRSAS
jgi:hypothetical protein